MKKIEITQEQREQILPLYNKGLKDEEIARTLNIPAKRVKEYRKDNNLNRNIGAKALAQASVIRNLLKEGVTLPEISEIIGIKIWSIRKYYQKMGISSLVKFRSYRYNSYNIGPREKSILLGIVLGDGTLYVNPNGKEARFTVRHGPKQKKYSEYIFECFRSMQPTIKTVYIKGHYIGDIWVKGSYQTEVRLRKNPYITGLYKLFYPERKKVIPFELLDIYTAESLAFHFMDDGSKSVDENGNINGFILSTQSFSYEENIRFIGFLKGKFNLDSTYIKSNNTIKIKTNSVKRFISTIEPYLIDSMKYKISPSKIS